MFRNSVALIVKDIENKVKREMIKEKKYIKDIKKIKIKEKIKNIKK
jgi:hypothetical protein